MGGDSVSVVRTRAGRLSYHDLDALADSLHGLAVRGRIVVDLAEADRTTTAALARLVVIRGRLRRAGGDLRLTHLHGRTKSLYEINRLCELLPCEAAE